MTTLLKSEFDYKSRMSDARQSGLKEGFAKGRNEASLDIAQKMKTMGFGGTDTSRHRPANRNH